jgi:hypothetical protein
MASDMAFVKATCTIGGRDAVEEYMACGLFPLSMSLDLGEIAVEETPVSKLPIARLPEESNDGFQGRVEVAMVNVVWKYSHGEHRHCRTEVMLTGCLNRPGYHTGHLEPGSEASKEAALKHKSDAAVGPAGKHVKAFDCKTVPSKMLAVAKGIGAASSKAASMKAATSKKAAHAKSAPKANVASRAGALPKSGAPLGTAVSKTSATVTAPRVGVLKISARTKRPASAQSPAVKGKQARIDVRPPRASATILKALV